MRERLSKFVLPHVGQSPVDAMTTSDVLSFLAPLAAEKPPTGQKVKSVPNKVFKRAIAQGYRADYPADTNINQALPKLAPREPFKVLPQSRIGAALQGVRDSTT